MGELKTVEVIGVLVGEPVFELFKFSEVVIVIFSDFILEFLNFYAEDVRFILVIDFLVFVLLNEVVNFLVFKIDNFLELIDFAVKNL